VACNFASGGGPLIVSARGDVLAEAGPDEAVIMGDIDLCERDQVRREITCFADRRPEVY